MRHSPPPLSPSPHQVGIENCKQLFSQLLAFTTEKIATHSTGIISAVGVALFSVVNASCREKSCLRFLIPTAVFHILLRGCWTYFVTDCNSAISKSHGELHFLAAIWPIHMINPQGSTMQQHDWYGGLAYLLSH